LGEAFGLGFCCLNYFKGDVFIVKIIRARPYGSGFYGLRYASEHPADGSPSGPANPSRNFFRLKYFFWAMPSAWATSGSLPLGYLRRKNATHPYRINIYKLKIGFFRNIINALAGCRGAAFF